MNMGCFVWANKLATSIELVKHWCDHYKKFNFENIYICLNAYGTMGDDVSLFNDVFKTAFPESEISISQNPYNVKQVTNYHQKNLDKSQIYTPLDIDEFISPLLLNYIPELLKSNCLAIRGRCVDRSAIKKEMLYLREVYYPENLKDQFPRTEKIRQTLAKSLAIKKGAHIMNGNHYIEESKQNPKCYMNNIIIPIDHYCWTKNTLYNRKNRTNRAVYEKTQAHILKSAIIDE